MEPISYEMNLSNIDLHRYESTTDRRKWTVWLLYLIMLLTALTIVSDWMEISLLNKVIDGERVFFEDLESNDDRQVTVAGIYLLGIIVTSIVYLIWNYRAYKNVNALTPYGTERTTKWAVWSWIIPFISLVYPYQNIREIWRESYSRDDPQRKVGDGLVSPGVMKWWWGMWLLSNQVGGRVLASAFGDQTAESLRNSDYVSVVAGIISIIAAYLAIQVVEMVDDQQRSYYYRLSAATPTTGSSSNKPSG